MPILITLSLKIYQLNEVLSIFVFECESVGGNMPCEVDWAGDTVTFRMVGEVEFHELANSNDNMVNQPDFGNIKYQIADFTECDELIGLTSIFKTTIETDFKQSFQTPDIYVIIANNKPELNKYLRVYMDYMNQFSSWKVSMHSSLESADEYVHLLRSNSELEAAAARTH